MPMLISPWRTIASGSKLAFSAGMPAEGHGHGLGHEVAQRELDLLGGELPVQVLADRDQLVDPDVHGDVDLGGRLLGLDHPLGDRLAHPGVGNPLVGQRRTGGGRAAVPARPRASGRGRGAWRRRTAGPARRPAASTGAPTGTPRCRGG